MSLADVAFTLLTGAAPAQQRWALVRHGHADAIEQLRSDSAKVQVVIRAGPLLEGSSSFPGRVPQYPAMGAELYRSEPVFREALDECALFLKKCSGFDLWATLFPQGACGGARPR